MNGFKNGKGKKYRINRNLYFKFNDLHNDVLEFEGEYLNDLKNGKGKEYDKNGNLIFEGEYLKGERWNGKGKEYDNNGEITFECEYINGEKHKK